MNKKQILDILKQDLTTQKSKKITVNNNKIEFNIKRIGLNEIEQIIYKCVDAVFNQNLNENAYYSMQFITDIAIITNLTDIDLDINIENIYQFYLTEECKAILQEIKTDEISKQAYDLIQKSVPEHIKIAQDKTNSTNVILDAVLYNINSILESVSKFTNVDINSDEISNAIKNLSQLKNISQDKIVDKILSHNKTENENKDEI